MISINGNNITNSRFPNGELKVNGEDIIKGLKKNNFCHFIDFKYDGDSSILELFFISNFIKNKLDMNDAILNIEYLPYSRMDRVEESGDVFTLKYISEMINSFGYGNVIIGEPHSNVSLALINNSKPDNLTIDILHRAMNENNHKSDECYVMYPDSSAHKKYSKDISSNYLLGVKIRDFATGKITNYDILSPFGSYNKKFPVYIVDDLCSKGTTAYNAALKLKTMGFNEVYLVVGHCENAVFLGPLVNPDSPVKCIYTSDSIIDQKLVDTTGKIKVI